MYLIKKIRLDPMENELGQAVGYTNFGYKNTEEEAKEFCSKGKIYTRKDCWALAWGDANEYTYERIDKI